MAQTEKNEKIVKNVMKMLDEAKTAKGPHEAEFKKFYKFYRGDQWEKKPPRHRSDIVINVVFSNVETIVPIMTDNRPIASIKPRGPEDRKVGDTLKYIEEFIWDNTNMDRKTPQVVRDSLIYGPGYMKTYWDPELEGGMGDIAHSVIDPLTLYLDPGTGDDIKNAEYVCEVTQMNIGKAKSKWPDLDWDEIKPASDEDAKRPSLVRQIISKFTGEDQQVTDSTGAETTWQKASAGDYEYTKDRVTIIEVWYKDYSFESFDDETGETGEDGQPVTKKSKKMKYPNGRRTVVVGGLKAEDGKNIYGWHPYDCLPDYDLAHETIPEGDVKQIIPPQKDINVRTARMNDHFRLGANSPWWYTDKYVNPDHISDKTGIKIPVKRGGALGRVQIAPMPGDILATLQDRKRDVDIISGINEVTQGRRPGGITAASAISKLQEAAQARIRAKGRNLEHFIKNVGHKDIDLILKFYTEPRMFRIYDPARGKDQFAEFNFITGDDPRVTDQGLGGSPDQRFVEDEVNEKTGKIKFHEVGKFDIIIGAGSTLPVDRDARTDLGLTLFKLQAIDRQALLDDVDYPNRDEVGARMAAKEQQAMAQGSGGAKDDPDVQNRAQKLKDMGVPPEEIQAALAGGR